MASGPVPRVNLAKSRAFRHIEKTFKNREYTILTQVGRDDEGADPFTSHMACCVGLQPYKEWPPGKRKSDLIS